MSSYLAPQSGEDQLQIELKDFLPMSQTTTQGVGIELLPAEGSDRIDIVDIRISEDQKQNPAINPIDKRYGINMFHAVSNHY